MGSASYLLTPHQEGRLPEEGFRSVSLSAPDWDHWSIHVDKMFAKLIKCLTEECQQSQEEAKAGEAVEEGEGDLEEQEGGKPQLPPTLIFPIPPPS